MDGERWFRPPLRQIRHLGDQAGWQWRAHGHERSRPQGVNRLPSPFARSGPAGDSDRKPLLLSANDDATESSGFYRVNPTGTAAPQKIVMVPKSFGTLTKARDSNRVVFTLSRFDEFSDLWVSDTTFKDIKKISDANPQQAEYVWGKSELMHYINADGRKLRAIVTKPDNFDPNKNTR
jgi:dipeptidyl aminopeptidase/acylaminoacyl peptidase